MPNYDKEKLKEGFKEDSDSGYASGFVSALILVGVNEKDIEYITGKSIEYWS